MLDNKRQNYHHSVLPNSGDIVTFPTLACHSLERSGKWIVESFNLTDSPDYHHSYGIHTVNLHKLGRPDIQITVSGFWCDVQYWM